MLEKATAHGLDIKSSAFECFRPKSWIYLFIW
jgi:hypothetical protein